MTSTKRKILCVDDDADDLSFLADAIHDIDPDLEIVEKKNGVEAIRFLTEAIVTDDLPVSTTLPGVWARRVIGFSAVAFALRTMAWSFHS